MMDAPERKSILYAACVSPLADARMYATACEAVSPGRKGKTDRLQREEARWCSLGGELLLRYGLREAGLEQFPAEYVYGPEGKPGLSDGRVRFNLSHSGAWVICAVSEVEVGCDIQEIRPVDLTLARRFHEEEWADIEAQLGEELKKDCFYRYWTLKESFMKAVGLGFGLPLKAFRVIPGARVTVEQSVNDRSYSFREFDEIPGYRCALCLEGEDCDARLEILDLAALL